MSSILKILVDIPCEVYCDYELKGEATPQSIFKIELRKGTYILEFKQKGEVLYSQEYKMQSNDEDDLLKVSLVEFRKKFDREEQYRIIENLYVTCRRTDDNKFVIENNNDGTVTPINYSISTDLYSIEFDKCGLLNVNVGGTENIEYLGPDGEFIQIDGGKWGCINKLGAIQIPIIYDSKVYFNNPNVTAALIEDRIVFINKWNEIVFANPYDEVELEDAFVWRLCIVAKNGKYGIINDNGTETLPLRYSKIIRIRHLNVFSVEDNGKWGLVDDHCRFITPLMYDSLSYNARTWHHFSVVIDKREGIIDDKGETVIPLKYDKILENYEGFFIVTKENKKGVYKETGECILDIKYDDVKEYYVFNRRTHYFFVVSLNGKMGVFDDKGEAIFAIDYDNIQDFGGYFLVEKDSKKGVFKENNLCFILDIIYDDCIRVKLGKRFLVTLNGKMGLFDENGDAIFAIEYDTIQEMDHGYFLVEKNGKKGVFVACKQPCILDTIYDNCEEVRRWANHKELSYFIVSKNGKRGLFDGGGKQVLDIFYDSIDIRTDFIVVIKNGYLIIYSYDGHILFDKGYQLIPIISEMRVAPELRPYYYKAVKRNGKWGCINTAFEEIQHVEDIALIREHIPCEYDKIAYENKEIILESNADICRFVSYFIKIGMNGKHLYYKRNDETLNMDLVWIEPPKTEAKGYYLFFDTETTGIPNNYNAPSSNTKNWPRLVQLAWILTDFKGIEIHRGNLIIKPNGFTIPTDATKIHGITTQTALEKGVALADAISQFNKDLSDALYVVGHNVVFDMKIVGAEMIRLGMKDELSKKKGICTMKSTVEFCKIPGYKYPKYPKLQELYRKLFGHEYDNAHNAMSDVEATKKCYFELIKRKILFNNKG